MGQSAGHFYQGSHYKVSHLPKLKQWAKELLARDAKDFHLPDDAFVFFNHGGYFFMYFLTGDQQNDPPVYAYNEMEEKPTLAYEKLSDQFNSEINAITRLKEKELQERRERMQRNNL